VARLVRDGARVVVIDDDLDMLELVKNELSLAGNYQVITACNGREGLARIAERRPDLVILDLMMPEVDGFGVLEQLECDEATRAIPVVVLTAVDLSSEEQAYLTRRVNSFLSKDVVHSEHLLGRVNSLLALSKQALGKGREKVANNRGIP
jgi:CheY-like chemotaxis protein